MQLIGRCLKQDVAVRVQRGDPPRRDRRARHRDIAIDRIAFVVLARPARGDQRDISAAANRAAGIRDAREVVRTRTAAVTKGHRHRRRVKRGGRHLIARAFPPLESIARRSRLTHVADCIDRRPGQRNGEPTRMGVLLIVRMLVVLKPDIQFAGHVYRAFSTAIVC